MRLTKHIILFLLIFQIYSGNAQEDFDIIDPMLIQFQAKIISAADSAVIPYANIVNNRTHSGTISNANGYFTLEMLNIDSLIISSVGHQKSVLKVPRNYNEYEVFNFVMKPVNYSISEVKVTGDKPHIDLGFETGQPTTIAAELRGDAFNERPPILAALFNPISYWQYYLSKKEKRKRKVREAMVLEKNWEMHSKNYNKEMVQMLTGLNELQADTFMVWFNGQNILPYTASEYQVRASILEYFQMYKFETGIK